MSTVVSLCDRRRALGPREAGFNLFGAEVLSRPGAFPGVQSTDKAPEVCPESEPEVNPDCSDSVTLAERSQRRPRAPRKPRDSIGGFEFYPRLKIWKGHNGKATYDPATGLGKSYGWWNMIQRIGGLTVFNDYRYSVTTTGHQSGVQVLLEDLGVKIDLVIPAPRGLQDLPSAERHLQGLISDLAKHLVNPRANRRKNRERRTEVKRLQAKLAQVKALQRSERRSSSETG